MTQPVRALFCKTCKREKPGEQFLWGGQRGRTKVRICNDCSAANMRRYWSTRMVGRRPEEFTDAGD